MPAARGSRLGGVGPRQEPVPIGRRALALEVLLVAAGCAAGAPAARAQIGARGPAAM